jgi:hypothetical protein
MNSKRSYFLILPTLMILGIHLFAHTEAAKAAANVHHERVNHAIHESELIFNLHHLGLSHGNHLHLDMAHGDAHYLYSHAQNGQGKTWQKAKWNSDNKWDEQARRDMIARIVSEGWEWAPRAESFGKQTSWLPGWELRWWSFTGNDGREVWVYHARSKSSGQRYTSFTNHVDGKLQNWVVAR